MISLFLKYIVFSILLYSFLFADIKDKVFLYHNNLLNIIGDDVDIYNETEIVNYIYDNNLYEDYSNELDNYNLTLNIALNDPDFFLKVDKVTVDSYKIHSKYFNKVKMKLRKKDKSKVLNTFEIEDVDLETLDLIEPTYSNYFNGDFILTINAGLSSSQSLFWDINKLYTNGKTLDLFVYHPDPVKIFKMTNLLAFSLSKHQFKSGWHKNYTSNSFNIHIINFLTNVPLSYDLSLGICDNYLYDGGMIFKTSLNYKLEFEPIDLLFDISYNKFIDFDDENSLNFESLDYLLLNIKLSKLFKINI